MPDRYGSLATGIAQLDRAVESVFGAELTWYAEIDPDACKVLARLYPGVPNLGDLTAVDWAGVEPVDLIVAGIPCQPYSVAGKRKGWDDERAIWPHVADAVRVLRPHCLVLENVPGFIRLGLPRVLGDLAELGFDAEWGTLHASDVGACHRRERLFLVAYSDGEPLRDQSISVPRRSGEAECGGIGAGPAPNADGEGRASDERLHGTSPRRSGDAPPPDAAQLGPVRSRRTRGRRTGPTDGSRFPWGRYQPAIDRHERAFGRPAPWPVLDGTRSLNGEFLAWMMDIPEGLLDGLSNTAKKRLCGNAVVARCAETALRLLMEAS